jgi:type IV fimbrial biogenesis protein FimT
MNSKYRGFSLVELLVVMGLMAILLTLAVPAFTGSQLTTQLRTSANNLVASAHLARSEAIKRNAVVRLCVSADGLTCSTGDWSQGWIITSGGQVLHREAAISNRYHVVAAADNFDFQPTGVDTTAGNFVICRALPQVGPQERIVVIDAIGRAWTQRTSDGVCP